MLGRTTGGPGKMGRRLYYSAGERVVVAETTEAAFLGPAKRLFPAYEIPCPTRLLLDRVDVGLRLKSGEYAISSADAPDILCKTQMDAIVAFEFALSRALATSCEEHIHLHASGAVVDGQAILALGSSGAGKSSLAATMLLRGYPTLGDDTVFLDSVAKAAPFKRLLKVSADVLRELGVDPTDTVFWDPAWPEAWYEPEGGAGWADDSPVAVIALAQFDPHATLRLNPVGTADALNAVVHSVMVTGLPAGEGFERLVRVVESANVVRLTFSSAREAADALCSLVR